jgi:hypothetical protein
VIVFVSFRYDLTYLIVQRPASIVVGIIGTHQGPTPIETSWKQEEAATSMLRAPTELAVHGQF